MKEQEKNIEEILFLKETMQTMINEAIQKGFVDEEKIKKEWDEYFFDETWSI